MKRAEQRERGGGRNWMRYGKVADSANCVWMCVTPHKWFIYRVDTHVVSYGRIETNFINKQFKFICRVRVSFRFPYLSIYNLTGLRWLYDIHMLTRSVMGTIRFIYVPPADPPEPTSTYNSRHIIMCRYVFVSISWNFSARILYSSTVYWLIRSWLLGLLFSAPRQQCQCELKNATLQIKLRENYFSFLIHSTLRNWCTLLQAMCCKATKKT